MAELTAAEVEEIERALAALAPVGVTVGALALDARFLDELFPREAEAVARAVDQRRIEFATGRSLLRRLIGADVEIPVAPGRGLVVPAGVTATLAHDDAIAIAATSVDPDIAALGIDIEPDAPLEPEVAAVVLRHDEGSIDAHLAFTLKEAVYKAWSTLGGPLLEHHQVRVDADGDRFTADVLIGDDHRRMNGAFAMAAGRWLALVVTFG